MGTGDAAENDADEQDAAAPSRYTCYDQAHNYPTASHQKEQEVVDDWTRVKMLSLLRKMR